MPSFSPFRFYLAAANNFCDSFDAACVLRYFRRAMSSDRDNCVHSAVSWSHFLELSAVFPTSDSGSVDVDEHALCASAIAFCAAIRIASAPLESVANPFSHRSVVVASWRNCSFAFK